MFTFGLVPASRVVLAATVVVLVTLGPSAEAQQQHPSQGLVGWSSVEYDAGNFGASGSMTWSVEEGDVWTYKYVVIGKTMTLAFFFVGTSVGGTPSSQLRIKVPGGYEAASKMVATSVVNQGNTGNLISFCYIDPADATWLSCYAAPVAPNWSSYTNTTNLSGQITFEVQ